jgi:hypothetical protein
LLLLAAGNDSRVGGVSKWKHRPLCVCANFPIDVCEKYFPAIENRASKGYNAEAIGMTFDPIDSQELERLSNNEEITVGYPLCSCPRSLQYHS